MTYTKQPKLYYLSALFTAMMQSQGRHVPNAMKLFSGLLNL